MSEPPVLLIVDDEEGILRAMRRSLRREGYTIVTVQHADDVRDALEAHPVDVVLSDYKMGAISGLDVLALAAEIRPGARRLIISGFGEAIPPDRLAAIGVFVEPLRKPCDDAELKQVLRAAVEAGPPSGSAS